MRKMKMKLADDKDYVFMTLTLRQMRGFQKLFNDYDAGDDERLVLQRKDNLNEEQQKRLDELQNQEIDFLLTVARASLARSYPEFHTDSKEEVERVNERLLDLFDMNDLTIILNFVMTGKVAGTREELVSDIDLTFDT